MHRHVPHGRDHGAALDGSRSSSRALQLAGEEFALGSPQRLGRILFEKLEATPGRKGKTGYSTDPRCSARSAPTRVVPVIEERRELTKLVDMYLGPLPTLIGEDGRLHTINETDRRDRAALDDDPNLQAIPIRTELGRQIRSASVAEQGSGCLCRLLGSSSHPRARLASRSCARRSTRRGHLHGHRRRGARQGSGDADEDERNVAKMINFGIVYGISAFGLSENLDIPKEQAQAYIDAYLARFPHVQAFIARTIAQASEDGYATSLQVVVAVPELRAMNRQTRGFGERVAVNFVMQGSNADIIKVAMVAIHDRLRAEDALRASFCRSTTSSCSRFRRPR